MPHLEAQIIRLALTYSGPLSPPTAFGRIAMICVAVYLRVFLQNPLVHLAEKMPLMQRITFGGSRQLQRPKAFSLQIMCQNGPLGRLICREQNGCSRGFCDQ